MSLLYYQTKLRTITSKYYTRLAHWILIYPKSFILVPISIVFVLSYPALYALITTPTIILSSYTADFRNVGSQLTSLYDVPDLAIKQLWLQPNFVYYGDETAVNGGALTKQFLLDSMDLQEELFRDVNVNNRSDGVAIGFVHSPLDYWNRSREALLHDQLVLKTIHTKGQWKSEIGLPLSHQSVMGGIIKVNGLIKSAKTLQIAMFYRPSLDGSADAGLLWERNIRRINEKNANSSSKSLYDRFSVFDRSPDLRVQRRYLLKVTPMNGADHFVLIASYILITFYFVISLSNVHSVKSRMGLFIAFIVEMTLAVLSASTITAYLYKGIDLFHIPLQVLPFVVIVVGIENMFRLVSSICLASEELPVPVRLAKGLEQSGVVSSLIVAVDLLVLGVIAPFVVSGTKQFCVFASIALIIDHILHLTYFTAVLSVDLRRLELEDLLQKSGFSEKQIGLGRGALLSSVLLGANSHPSDRPDRSSVRHVLGQALLKVKMPFSTTITSSIIMVLFLVGSNLRWIDGGNIFSRGDGRFDYLDPVAEAKTNESVISTLTINTTSSELPEIDDYPFAFFLNQKVFGSELLDIYNANYNPDYKLNKLSIVVSEPNIAIYANTLDESAVHSQLSFNLNTTYKFNGYYLLEFVTSLVFILSMTTIILRVTLKKQEEGNDLLKSSDQMSQMLQVTGDYHANDGEDKVFEAKELINGHYLDILRIATAECTPFIVSIGLDHKVLVWSPISKPLPSPTELTVDRQFWPVSHVILGNKGNYITLFSKNGNIQCFSRMTMSYIWSVQLDDFKGSIPLEGFFRQKTVPAFLQRKIMMQKQQMQANGAGTHSRRSSVGSIASVNTLSFATTGNASLDGDRDELVLVSKSGIMYVISCVDGTVREEKLNSEPLVAAEKLSTPRVSDRLVCLTLDGSIIVATVMNNKWKVRKLAVQKERYNRGLSLMTPAALSRRGSIGKRPAALDLKPENGPQIIRTSVPTLAIVSFVGMIVRTRGVIAELIDIQTGTLVKEFHIGQFRPGSFKVFHSEPTHCRFCGCTSVSSFSIVYTELESDTVIMHTFSIDHRAKNNICLRVERDPRETRCLGFDSTNEHQHWLENMEEWDLTDLNSIMGLRRKRVEETEVFESIDPIETSNLRSRKEPPRAKKETVPHLNTLWEGFTMNSNGKVTFYDVPNGKDEGLLIKRISCHGRFGHKAMVVCFGNVMKILYLGNDDLIENEDDDGKSKNENVSGLSFVNKRRRHVLQQKELNGGTNFAEVSLS